jgi:uncharacterized membrane protein (DUF4010 family)
VAKFFIGILLMQLGLVGCGVSGQKSDTNGVGKTLVSFSSTHGPFSAFDTLIGGLMIYAVSYTSGVLRKLSILLLKVFPLVARY